MSSNEELKQNDSELIKTINRSLDLLRYGKFEEALDSFSFILKKNYSNSIAESGIKCCKYWISRSSKIEKMNENFEKGKLLFEEWKKFEVFTKSVKNIQSKVIHTIMYFIFNTALESFKKDLKENKILDFEKYFIVALSYKKIGDFKNAIKYFKESFNIDNENSNVIAQLADCYALIDEEIKAKLLFREAFFIDPSSIDLDLLDSNIITYLTAKILEANISKKEIVYWIPIYGRVLGIFNIIRELIPVEISKLRREIIYVEKNYNSQLEKDNIIKTKLLNSYFWLYDFIKNNNKESDELKDLEYKIENISLEIYNLFKDENNIKQELS